MCLATLSHRPAALMCLATLSCRPAVLMCPAVLIRLAVQRAPERVCSGAQAAQRIQRGA